MANQGCGQAPTSRSAVTTLHFPWGPPARVVRTRCVAAASSTASVAGNSTRAGKRRATLTRQSQPTDQHTNGNVDQDRSHHRHTPVMRRTGRPPRCGRSEGPMLPCARIGTHRRGHSVAACPTCVSATQNQGFSGHGAIRWARWGLGHQDQTPGGQSEGAEHVRDLVEVGARVRRTCSSLSAYAKVLRLEFAVPPAREPADDIRVIKPLGRCRR
jgi:hypothetical protein